MSKLIPERHPKIIMAVTALMILSLLPSVPYSCALGTQGLAPHEGAVPLLQCGVVATASGGTLEGHSGGPKRSAGDLPTGQLLTELILHMTGINKPSVIQLLNETLTERSSEAGPLLADLCDFVSKYRCPSCADTRAFPKTALDPRVRLHHAGSWEGFNLPVIFIKKTGRLGNIMCEYATAFALQKIYNVSSVLTPHFSRVIRRHFKSISLPTIKEFRERECTPVRMDFDRRFKYQALELAAVGLLGPKRFLFEDFIFDMEMVNAFKEEVRKELTFHDRIRQKATARLQNYTSKVKLDVEDAPMTVVGVHVRLTDYPVHMRRYYKVQDVEEPYESYLRRAVDYFTTRHSNVVFVVTSDDDARASSIFQQFGLRNVFLSRGSPEEDMCLLTLCDHNIITFGSFGFWTGYLGRGTTVYPDLRNTTVEYCFSKTFYEQAQVENFIPVFFR